MMKEESKKHPLVEKLEKRLLPEFEEIAERIRQEIPNIGVTVYSLPCGSLTTWQGHDFHIDCLLMDIVVMTDNPDDLPDNIALTVGLGHLTTVPKMFADVVWGYPSGSSEANFRDDGEIFPNEGMIVTDELLEDLYADLPRLYEALFEALRRRKPKDMC